MLFALGTVPEKESRKMTKVLEVSLNLWILKVTLTINF